MNRPWKTWLAFALSTGLALTAMAWLTGEAVRADLDRNAASKQAELEQQVSLVLCVEGEVELGSQGQPVALRSGEAGLVPAGLEHHLVEAVGTAGSAYVFIVSAA
jgi:glyoxylate utilization-related uncharacterized protein